MSNEENRVAIADMESGAVTQEDIIRLTEKFESAAMVRFSNSLKMGILCG